VIQEKKTVAAQRKAKIVRQNTEVQKAEANAKIAVINA